MDIKHYIENTELTLANIAEQCGVSDKRVRKVWVTYPKAYRTARKSGSYRRSKLGDLNPMTGVVGKDHPGYVGDVSDNKGYLMRVKPEWYTGRRRSRHVFVHQLVVSERLGITEIPAGWCVHHCDENPHNNDFDNLVLMMLGEHAALHSSLKGAETISKESTLKWVEARRAGTPAKI